MTEISVFLVALLHTVQTFVAAHSEGLALYGLALIASLPEELPTPFSKVATFAWTYSLFRTSFLTLMSFRGIGNREMKADSSKKVLVDEKGARTITEHSSISTTQPDIPDANKETDKSHV